MATAFHAAVMLCIEIAPIKICSIKLDPIIRVLLHIRWQCLSLLEYKSFPASLTCFANQNTAGSILDKSRHL